MRILWKHVFGPAIRLLVAAMLLGATPVWAATTVAKVVSAVGTVTATQPDGAARALQRRSEVFEGDTIVTGADSNAQIRFSDGALVQLRAETEFRVDAYKQGGAEGDSAAMTLLKGGLRTVTGTIGRDNKDDYNMATRVATIGLRGTHYGLRDCQGNCTNDNGESLPDGLYGGVLGGAVVASNNGGQDTFKKDEYFYIADIDTAPKRLNAPPGVVFDQDMAPDTGIQPQAGDVPGLDGTNDGLSPDFDAVGDLNSVPPGGPDFQQGEQPTPQGRDQKLGDSFNVPPPSDNQFGKPPAP